MGPHPAVAAVRLAVRRSLADLPPGTSVVAACSGGADSTALAAALAFEARRAGWRALGVTVDHGLQPGSPERAATVATTMRDLGLDPVEVLPVVVAGPGGPEAAARRARRAALSAAAARHEAPAVLLGHSLDDQAESVLLGLARGSGGRSLAAMAPVSGIYRRPFLALRRTTLRTACAAAGLPVWDDPHNEDSAYTRIRVRRSALPALEAALGPGVAEALARTAALLRDDADALDDWAEAVAASVTLPGGDLDVAGLLAAPAAVRRRVLRRAAVAAGAPPTDLSATHVDALERLVLDWHGQGPVALPGPIAGRRHCDRLTLAPRAPDPAAPSPKGRDRRVRGRD